MDVATIRRLVATGLNKLPTGLRVSVSYVSVTPGAYDPDTGSTADTIVTIGPFVTPIVRPDEKEAATFPAPDKIQVILVHYDNLEGRGITPNNNDYFMIGGVKWEIVRIKGVPGQIITKFFVEQP